MPPSRKSKPAKSQGKRGERTSPRKRNVPKVSESTPIEKKDEEPKTPKRSRRARSKAVPPRTPSTSFDCTPSTSYASTSRSTRKDANEEITCAFYKVTKGKDGKEIFSKALLKYFMTVDSPEMEDLRKKRFNTSFLHETPRQRNIQIYTEEEDKDPKWTENVPELNFDMPEVPGSEHTHIFDSIPVGDSDEEFKRFVKGGDKKTTTGRRRSSRVTAFRGKPLPEQALAVDYSGVLDSESSRDRDDDECEGIEMENEEADIVELSRDGSVNENKNSILLTLLSAPPNGAGRPYTYISLLPSICADIFRKKEDEMLLNKYRDVMGNRQVNVVLTRLPIDDKLFKLCGGKKKVLEAKKPVNKSLKGPRLGLSKLQKKKRGGHTKF